MTTWTIPDTHIPVTDDERTAIEHNREQADIDWRGRFDYPAAQSWYRRAVELARARRDQLTTPVEHGGGRYATRGRG